ncbi:MAG: arabinofuranosyltransferase [candidate division Zixibacteria bacterium]|nr:arabinofuranosyltransferase [candidate division Zixibacteria bacterium]
MSNVKAKIRKHGLLSGLLTAFFLFGLGLIIWSWPLRIYTEDRLIYDLMWLDAWGLSFCLATIFVWVSKLSTTTKVYLGLMCLSLYGVVTVSLIFDGTDFPDNSYWGDNKFRLAMILKFATVSAVKDYYYKDLPLFYPPIYYWLLAFFSKLMSIDAYKMMKIGSQYIYLLSPPLLFVMWRRILDPFRAFLVAALTVLICSSDNPLQLYRPHAFLGNSFFLPWWLLYIEQVKPKKEDWKFYVSGGLIGAIIFATYFYAFFIGALAIVARSTIFRKWSLINPPTFSLTRAWAILALGALISFPYWLPSMQSVWEFGSDRSRGDWHHSGSTGISFSFLSFSLVGLLFLAGIFYGIKRRRTSLNRGLLVLLAAVPIYFLIGSVLGALDHPINLIKSQDFLQFLAAPLIGLWVAAMIRADRFRIKARFIVPAAVVVLLVVLVSRFGNHIREVSVKTARTAQVQTWNTDPDEMRQRAGSVFLSGHEEFFVFYPVYTFISINEVYSHPAARFIQRYELLYLTQFISDPYLFNIVLRHNKYDAVDYFMPRKVNDQLEVTIALSHYPNLLAVRNLHYPPGFLYDSTLFRKQTGDLLFEVMPNAVSPGYDSNYYGLDVTKNPRGWSRLGMIRSYLTETGQKLWDERIGMATPPLSEIVKLEPDHSFDNKIHLLSMNIYAAYDSLYLTSIIRINRDLHEDYRVLFHLYPKDKSEPMLNYDFATSDSTIHWRTGDMKLLSRTIPKAACDFDYHIGFFSKEEGVMGDVYEGEHKKE